jgi:hypothetical protein
VGVVVVVVMVVVAGGVCGGYDPNEVMDDGCSLIVIR